MLSGEYHHQIDEKGRIRIPPDIKAELGDNLLITISVEGCLCIDSYEKGVARLTELESRVDEFDPDDKYRRALTIAASMAYQVQPDKTGRFLLKKELIKYAGIKKNIVTVGGFNRAELWSEEKWNENFKVNSDTYANLLRGAAKARAQKAEDDKK